jgi:hypothetical protein
MLYTLGYRDALVNHCGRLAPGRTSRYSAGACRERRVRRPCLSTGSPPPSFEEVVMSTGRCFRSVDLLS